MVILATCAQRQVTCGFKLAALMEQIAGNRLTESDAQLSKDWGEQRDRDGFVIENLNYAKKYPV